MSSDPRLHVLHVIGSLQLGGAETLLFRLATAPDGDVRHEIICLGKRGWYSDQIERHGITVHHLGMETPGSFLSGIPGFARLVRRLRPDLIHSWMYLANLLSGMIGRSAGIPVVWGIHGSTFDHLGAPSRLAAQIGGRGSRWLAAHVVNCSARSAAFHQRRGYAAAPGSVIHNGYDAMAFAPNEEARERARRALDIKTGQFVLGTVSRWHSEKDIPTLFEALGILRQRQQSPLSLLIGPGLDDENRAVGQAVRELDLLDSVRPLGMRCDMPDLARAIDLHVLPSRAEAFPNVIAETMLSGTPNVATDVGDSGTIVGETGWVVPPRRPDLLAEAIDQAHRECRDQPERWQARRTAARQRIATNFTSAAMRADYERLWRSVAARSR